MREIKFRGKRKDNGEWVYGYYAPVYLFEKDGEINNTYAILSDEIIGRAEMFGCGVSSGLPAKFIIKKETLCQYTGLKDKNGKEIYEGDILDVGGDYYGIIVFDYGGFKIRIFDTRGYYNKLHTPEYLEDYCIEQCEIIGNIYDNPELIK